MSAILPTQAPVPGPITVGGMVGAPPSSEEIPEELKQAILIQLNEFNDNSEELLRFPTSFEKNERSFINQSARKMGLLSKTVGKNSNKHVVVSRNLELAQASPWPLTLQHHSKHQIQNLLRDLPVRPNELADIQVQVELPAGSQQQISTAPNDQKFKDHNRRQMGKLCNSSTVATVPSRPLTNDVNYLEARQRLPIWNKKEQILRTIQENQVTIICGDTGCGKTTQVPQYILEDATNRQVPCFMYVTQPRRIAAIAAAERVSQERGERVGTSVGYQIRLEYRSTQKTVLTYCTNSVLLRALMLAGPHESLEQVTHIVIDEIHERDRYSDFLLIVLHDILPLRPYLRLVLMSATMDSKKFQEYFKNAPVIPVRSSTNNVEALFLEDVLRSTKYHEHIKDKVMTTEERVYRTSIDAVTNHTKRMKQGNPHSGLGGRFAQLGLGGEMDPSQFYPQQEGYEMSSDETFREILGLGDQGDSVDSSMEVWTMEPMDITMDNAREHFTEKEFAQILHFIMNESVGVDYHHTTSLMTPLMIAASKGCVEAVQKLLNLGADPNLKDLQGMTSFMHGKAFPEVLKMLKEHNTNLVPGRHDSTEETTIIEEEEVKDILTSYYDIVDSNRVDLDLIFYLISLIMDCDQDGSVLVFLPAYDDIMRLRSMLMQDQKIIHRVQIFMLHSSMQPFEQRKVFRKPPYGIRKVILSTNIAETSLTIDDVTFVIDSGKVKERHHDVEQGVIKFQNEWISKSSAVHRRGRAGRVRPGVCYHLFSRKRYTMFQEHTEPEIMRYPLAELALNCKVLAPHNMPIPEFLGKCLQSPSTLSLKRSLSELTTMEALTPWEELTTTGKHLAELPIDPQLGKVVLYSVVLKCLDPVLTIVCSLAFTDPFITPTSQKLKVSALQARRRFSINSQSDHLSSLKAFLGWQKARANGWENQFCEKNFLSLATLEMIEGLRAQIIAQLRSMGFIRQKGGVDIRNLNDNSDKWHVVKACLVGGLYPKLARADRANSCLTSAKHTGVHFHDDSAMNVTTLAAVPRADITKQSIDNMMSDWVVYDELLTDIKGTVSARCCTVVSPVTVALCAGPTGSPEESEVEEGSEEQHNSSVLQLDDWISIELQSIEQATAIKQLRLKFHALFQRRLKTPFSQLTQVDASILRCVVSILKQEEEPLNLTQPVGISQRPFRPYDHAYHTRYHMPSVVHSFNHHDDGDFDQVKQWQPLPQQSFISYNKPSRPFDNQIIYQENKPPFQNQLPNNMPQFPPKLPPAANPGYTPYNTTDDQYYNQGQARNEVYYAQGPQPAQVGSEPSRYFIMKCGNQRNIDNSVQTNYWYTSVSSEKKLNSAFAECKDVILIFSVQTSGHFQGYARMMSSVTPYKSDANNGGVVRIEWIKRANLPFQRCHHLYNPWNENRKVQIARDGQELEPSIGEELVRLWDGLPAPYQRPFYPTPPARPLAPLGGNYQFDNNYNAMGKPM